MMNKYERTTLAIILTVVIVGIASIVLVFSGYIIDSDSNFPFFILIPSWLPAIWIPIAAQKKQEQLKQQEQIKEQLGDD